MPLKQQAEINHTDDDCSALYDESYLHTPHLGTPPIDAPEDAFRNTHRNSEAGINSRKSNSVVPPNFARMPPSYTDEEGNYAADADTSLEAVDFNNIFSKGVHSSTKTGNH